jgi:drug/metabolite transporter superfamily protein YnfA
MTNSLVGCLAPEKWWADQRAKLRVVVLVIVLTFYGWLTAVQQLTVIEAAGVLVLIGLAAGVVIDRTMGAGTRPAGNELAVLHRLVDGVVGARDGGV